VADPSGAESDLQRPDRFLEKLSHWTLTLAGCYLLLVALLPDALGWDALVERFGLDRIVGFVVGFQFLYIAFLTRDRFRLQRLTAATFEALQKLIYGPDYRKQREAVDLLVRAVGTKNEAARRVAVEKLEELTGQSFGEDRGAWQRWWEANRSRFRARPGSWPAQGGAATDARATSEGNHE